MPLKFKTEVTRQFIAPSDGTKHETEEKAHRHEVLSLVKKASEGLVIQQPRTPWSVEEFQSIFAGVLIEPEFRPAFAALLRVPTKRKVKGVTQKPKRARKAKGSATTPLTVGQPLIPLTQEST